MIELALADIDNICHIYRTVGEAMYDEPRQRLACRFAKRLDEQQTEIKQLRSALLQTYDQLRWPGPALTLETKQAIDSAQQAARAAGGDS